MLTPGERQGIERIRGWRVRGRRAGPLTDAFETLARGIHKQKRRVGGVGRAWSQLVPPHLAGRTELIGVRGGVLSVRVSDAAAKFELDRFLRTGGEAELIRRSPSGLRRVRLVL